MDREQIESRIREIMAHYRVNQKFKPGRGRNYAYVVYAGPNLGRMRHHPDVKEVSGELTSGEAKALRDKLIVTDIANFIESLQDR